MGTKTLLIIDDGVLARRCFETGDLVTGFLSSLEDMRERFAADEVVVTWDGAGSDRQKLFPAYKQKRHARPWPERERYYAEVEQLKRELTKHAVIQVSAPGLESDDAIATLCRVAPRDEYESIVIYSNDHDLWPLLTDERVVMSYPGEDLPVRGCDLEAREGIRPEEAHRVACLAGCATDEVPGLRGVGRGRATRLVRACPDIVETVVGFSNGVKTRAQAEAHIFDAVRRVDAKLLRYANQALDEAPTVKLTANLVALWSAPYVYVDVGTGAMCPDWLADIREVRATVTTTTATLDEPQLKQLKQRFAPFNILQRTERLKTNMKLSILTINDEQYISVTALREASLADVLELLASPAKKRRGRKAKKPAVQPSKQPVTSSSEAA